MGTKAILMSVRDQLEDAIARVQQLTPAHKLYAEAYNTAEEFWKEVEEQSHGWDLGFVMKRGLEWRGAFDRPKFENIEHVYFWPAIRPLRNLLRRVSSYIDSSPV